MIYELIKPIAGIALNWYYRSIVVAGRSRIPATGPVFLAVNHPNALVDALVVAIAVPRPVHLTAKATIFANPAVAAFLRAAGVIALKRASDEVKRVSDYVVVRDSDLKSNHLKVEHQVVSGDSDRNSDHLNIDTNQSLQADPNHTLQNDTTNAVLDPSRNAEAFRAVGAALAAGHAIVIFPEGKSHDEPQLAPLRTGLARMALMARDTFNVRGIKIIPVGLLFEKKEAPRSRVLIQVGEVIEVDTLAHGEHAVESLTALVGQRLNAVTLNFESSEDAARIANVSETLAALIEPTAEIRDGGPPLSAILALARRTDRVRQALSGNASPELRERATTFQTRLDAFRTRLASEKINATDLNIEVDATPGVRFAIRETLIAGVLLPISWWGRIWHFVPIRIARLLALRGARNRDEPAMNTLVFGVALVLLTYAVLTTVVGALFGIWWALAFFVTLIPSASSELRYGDRALRRQQRMRTYLAFRKQPELRRELLGEADWLRREAGMIEQLALANTGDTTVAK